MKNGNKTLGNMIRAVLVAGTVLGANGCDSGPYPFEERVIEKQVQEEKVELGKGLFKDSFYKVDKENILFVGHPEYYFNDNSVFGKVSDYFKTYALYVDENTYNSYKIGDFLKKDTKYRLKRNTKELTPKETFQLLNKGGR